MEGLKQPGRVAQPEVFRPWKATVCMFLVHPTLSLGVTVIEELRLDQVG